MVVGEAVGEAVGALVGECVGAFVGASVFIKAFVDGCASAPVPSSAQAWYQWSVAHRKLGDK